jgi:hypothetical protein
MFETLKNILNIDHLWIEKRRLEYYMKKGDTFKLVRIDDLAIIPDKKGDHKDLFPLVPAYVITDYKSKKYILVFGPGKRRSLFFPGLGEN